MLKRESLVRYGKLSITSDTATALRNLESLAGSRNFKIKYHMPDAADGYNFMISPQLGLYRSGRCVLLEAVFESLIPHNAKLAHLWGSAIPSLFTPWDRYPIQSNQTGSDKIFNYLGIWQPLHDRLLAEGRGHLAWESVCIASECDVGLWEGDRFLERFVQAQLHRIGHNVGRIDGIIGARTATALRSIGLAGLNLSEMAEQLKAKPTGVPMSNKRAVGHLSIPRKSYSVTSSGKVHSYREGLNTKILVDGPGRLVIDIEGGVA